MNIINCCFLALFCVTAGTTPVLASDPGFAGHWKLNLDKSQFAGMTYTIEKKATGGYHFDSQGYAYDSYTDGKKYPAPDGSAVKIRITWGGQAGRNSAT